VSKAIEILILKLNTSFINILNIKIINTKISLHEFNPPLVVQHLPLQFHDLRQTILFIPIILFTFKST
jgi:hypothetical protein